jgi:hypothetical protein
VECAPRYPLNRRPIWTVGERKILLLLPGIEPQFVDCLDCSFLKPEVDVSGVKIQFKQYHEFTECVRSGSVVYLMLIRKIITVSSENLTQNVILFLARVKGLNKEGGNLCTLIEWLCMGTIGWLL